MLIFVIAEDCDDPLAVALIQDLVGGGWAVDHSPRNPGRGDDSRWENWYRTGCAEALSRADVFVGVATRGWSASTWMGHEGEAALDAGLPVFFWNPNGTKIPLGMRPLAERPLDDSLDAAVKQLAAYRAAPMSLLDRHLSRLFRFIKRMPGCPTWSDVLLAENIRDNDNFDSLLSPAAYTERFAQLLASRPWVNLHAVGLLQRTLVVSIEASGDARPRETDASVQLSGPENRVTAETGWKLALRHDG